MSDSSDILFNQPVIVEACEELVQRDRLELKTVFPDCSKMHPCFRLPWSMAYPSS
jgi:hypothetical protein